MGKKDVRLSNKGKGMKCLAYKSLTAEGTELAGEVCFLNLCIHYMEKERPCTLNIDFDFLLLWRITNLTCTMIPT